MKKFLKKIAAMAAVTAMTVTAIPMGSANAANNCTHDYHKFCLGFYSYSDDTHMHAYSKYDADKNATIIYYDICTIRKIYHGHRQECVKCGALTGGIGVHHGATFHLNSTETIKNFYCDGTGTDITGIY